MATTAVTGCKAYQIAATVLTWNALICSAGIGRTGTFCTLDIIMRRLKKMIAEKQTPSESDVNAMSDIKGCEWPHPHLPVAVPAVQLVCQPDVLMLQNSITAILIRNAAFVQWLWRCATKEGEWFRPWYAILHN